ncbi:MAG: NAD(P)H-dependent flavin oxidoreductase [Acidimicrobiales bacterium]
MPGSLHTSFCDLVGVRYPVVQTGMGWVAGARLTSATSEAGGLGILASATMSLEELDRAVAEVRSRTSRPFGVNLRSDHAQVGKFVDLLVGEEVAVASFAQAPDPKLIERLQAGGVVCIPTVAARRHAEKVAAWGVDAVIAQGHEGGGHTGPIPTSLLLPEVAAAVDLPVLGAGGFKDGRGLVAALAWGAAGIAMGTRFLLTAESTVPDQVKALYLAAAVTDTVVTTAVDGVPQRVIRTPLIRRLEASFPPAAAARSLASALRLRRLTGTKRADLLREGLAMHRHDGLSLRQVATAANAPMLTRAALVAGNPEAGILPTGQVAGLIESLPTVAEVITSIMTEAEEVLRGLGRYLPAEDPTLASGRGIPGDEARR